MSNNQPRFIWYRLVLDSVDGEAFRGASATKVSVPWNAEVDDFRKAVKADNPNNLSTVDAANLFVYENKDAFDNRKSVGGKNEPLQSSASLLALCTTEDEALIVAVPPPLSWTSSVDNPSSIQDISRKLYEELTRPFEAEPSLDQLREALCSKPLVLIPLDSRQNKFPFADDQFSKFFRVSTDESFDLSHLLIELSKMSFDPDSNGEATLHYYVDLFMKRILKGILQYDTMAIHVARNITDSSFITDHGLRPDFLFYVNSFLILRGKEKKTTMDLTSAQAELGKKLKSWNPVLFGALNYIFGFACAGESFQLYAMGPSGMVTDISRVFDLRQVNHRYELFFCIINLARLIKTIRGRIPQTSMMMYMPIKRQKGVTVEIRDDVVIKRIPAWQKGRLNFLRELYSAMETKSVPFVCHCREISITPKKDNGEDFIQLMITPLGCEFKPQTLDLLMRALSCVLSALEGVHKLGYAHSDVRWPNVLRVSDDYWILIDFENAVEGNEALFQNDIRMVGRLIDLCPFVKTMAVSMFRNTLMSDTPPNAADALKLLADLSHEVAGEMLARH